MDLLCVMLAAAVLPISAPLQTPDTGGGKIAWSRGDLEETLTKSKVEGRPVMAYFTAEWCRFCKRLDAGAFSDDTVVRLSEKYVRVLVDCTDRDVLRAMGERWKIAGVPAVQFYDAEGRKVGEVVGVASMGELVRRMAPGGEEARVLEKLGGEWRDTHRVELRNGNVIDGVLEESGKDWVVIRWSPEAMVRIKAVDIYRIQRLVIRTAGSDLPRVDLFTPVPAPAAEEEPNEVSKVAAMPSVEEILERVSGASRDRRQELMEELREFGVGGARHLLDRISALDPDRTSWALEALRRMKDVPFDEALRGALASPRADVRAGAVYILADRGAVSMVRSMTPLLRDPESAVRTAAVSAVTRLADAGALPDLVEASQDPEDTVRRIAVSGAMDLAKRTGADAELARMWIRVLRRADDSAQADLARGLGLLASTKKAADFPEADIREALTELLRDRGEAAREAAAGALGELSPDPATARALGESLAAELNADVAARLCNSLAKIGQGEREALEALIERLRSDNDMVRRAAEGALRRLTRQNHGSNYDDWREWYERNFR
ncbi:MAG: HEAT repeat domain-containing protein [Planctomycetes bacterium]|nr:HEAT repeat domain-containing protein [Planctomycetota bacterium]